jgi:hypothetical protein
MASCYSNLPLIDMANWKLGLGSNFIYVLNHNQAAMSPIKSHPFLKESPPSMCLLTFYDTSIGVLALS